uniref:Uncharacterized protein n=1 Tax=Arundo donax TaxID=35708 RepID=A0A0A8YZ98_ARUDO
MHVDMNDALIAVWQRTNITIQVPGIRKMISFFCLEAYRQILSSLAQLGCLTETWPHKVEPTFRAK